MPSEAELMALRLRQARENAGVTQSEVAQHLRVRRPAISQMERGHRRVLALEVKALAELYGCSVLFLLGIGSDDRQAHAHWKICHASTKGQPVYLSADDCSDLHLDEAIISCAEVNCHICSHDQISPDCPVCRRI